MSIFKPKNNLTVLACILVIGILAAGLAWAADVYYCPMHPNVVSDKTGECPICHMRLVKQEKIEAPSGQTQKESKELEGYSTVSLTAQKKQLIGIRTDVAKQKEMHFTLRVPARVAYDLELYEAQIKYLQEYRIAQGTLRNRELAFKNLTDSRWEAPRIEVARSKLFLMGMDDATVEDLVNQGKADESLIYLKPDGWVWVYAYVFESDAAQIRNNDRVILEVPSSGKKFEGMIHNIGPMVIPDTRQIHVHIRLKNDGTLKPEMLLNATIESSRGMGLVVPEQAVFFTGKNSLVFVEKGNGVYEPRNVKVGIHTGNEYQIVEGLSQGERVVIDGNFLLDSESRINASIQSAVAQQSAHAGHTQEGAGHD